MRLIHSLLAILPAVLAPTLAQAQAEPSRAATESCVDVQIGTQRAYDCINRRLQSATRQKRFTARDAPYNAASPAPAVNAFNQAATQERLGNAFGHSAQPQRPPPPVFSSPLLGGR